MIALQVRGPKTSTREVAPAPPPRLGVEPVLTGNEAPTAWLIDCKQAYEMFGSRSDGVLKVAIRP